MWFTYVAYTFIYLFIFLYSLTYFCIVAYQAYFALGAPQCGSRLANIMPGLIYASQDKLQIGNVREIALSSPRHRTHSKQGQKRSMMTPLQAHMQTHTHTHTHTHTLTQMHRNTHINGNSAAPSSPALPRANTDSIETVLLSVENIISCSGLKAPYGEMFFMVLM